MSDEIKISEKSWTSHAEFVVLLITLIGGFYIWIQGLQTNNMQVVYVPTEANLPILEATRLK